jgi:hypothetical protein
MRSGLSTPKNTCGDRILVEVYSSIIQGLEGQISRIKEILCGNNMRIEVIRKLGRDWNARKN